MSVTVEKLAEVDAEVGEGPMWDTDSQRLLWSDIATGRMFSYDPSSNTNEQIHSGRQVGGFVLNRQGGLVLFLHGGVALWRSDDDCISIFGEEHEGEQLTFNDVVADPGGRVFAGTYYGADRPGKLYRFDPDGTVRVVEEGSGISNGMGFSPDLGTMYYTDSAARTIYAYDYSRATGEIRNRRDLVVMSASEGIPDGMTVDAEGFIWSALWYGACVVRFDPDGKEERRLQVPAKQTSSAMFGGKDLDELYITTANALSEPDDTLLPAGYDWDGYVNGYRGGGLFRARVGVQGREEFRADFPWPAK